MPLPTYLGGHLGEASHPARGEPDHHEDQREDDMLEKPMQWVGGLKLLVLLLRNLAVAALSLFPSPLCSLSAQQASNDQLYRASVKAGVKPRGNQNP